MNIIQTKNKNQGGIQTRTTIPKDFVDEFNITIKDKVVWSNKKNELRGKLIKNGDVDGKKRTK